MRLHGSGSWSDELLPNLLATITARPIAERPGIAAQAAKRLAELAGDFDEKASLAARLEADAKGAEAAVEANGAAFDAWDQERSEEVVAKGRLRIELERTHRSLGAHFAGQRDFVESFFLKGEKTSEGAAEAEGAAGGEGRGRRRRTPSPRPRSCATPRLGTARVNKRTRAARANKRTL